MGSAGDPRRASCPRCGAEARWRLDELECPGCGWFGRPGQAVTAAPRPIAAQPVVQWGGGRALGRALAEAQPPSLLARAKPCILGLLLLGFLASSIYAQIAAGGTVSPRLAGLMLVGAALLTGFAAIALYIDWPPAKLFGIFACLFQLALAAYDLYLQWDPKKPPDTVAPSLQAALLLVLALALWLDYREQTRGVGGLV